MGLDGGLHRAQTAVLGQVPAQESPMDPTLRRVVKGDLTIQFVPQALTSYGGLELLQRYVRQIHLVARLRQALAGVRSD